MLVYSHISWSLIITSYYLYIYRRNSVASPLPPTSKINSILKLKTLALTSFMISWAVNGSPKGLGVFTLQLALGAGTAAPLVVAMRMRMKTLILKTLALTSFMISWAVNGSPKGLGVFTLQPALGAGTAAPLVVAMRMRMRMKT